MGPMWKGFVSFGLVTIPVRLYSAIERAEEIRFHLLHAKDRGKIRNKRVCELEGVEVAWQDIVKGYEVAKGEYVEITDEDLAKADVRAAQTVDILDFVKADEIDPKYFEQPYYIEPQKGSEKPYALLREALRRSGKVGVAKVVLRSREQLTCVRPDGNALVLEVMRFANEVREPADLNLPQAALAREAELGLAEELVDRMSAPFDITKYKDELKEKLEAIIREKIAGREPTPRGEAPKPTSVVDLMAALERSLTAKGAAGKRRAARHPEPARAAKRAPKRGSAKRAG